MKNLDKAIQYYKLSVKTATEVDSKQHLAQALYSLANAYFKSQSYTLASKESKLSLDISINQNYQDIIKDNYFLLSKISEITGMHSNALFYYKKASEIKDSIFNKENSIHFAEMQTRYETEKKERENIMLRKEEQLKNIQLKANKIEIQNQYVLILAFATLLLIFGVFAILLFKSRKDLLKSKALLTKQNKEINVQKEELFTQRENLKEINILLHDNSQALKVKKDELQGTISKLKKAIGYKHKIFSIIAHDLRGPIGTISSIISLVLDNQLSEEKRKKLLSTTKESTVATYTLLENLLIWANNEQGKINFKPQSLILVGIIESNIDLLRETANEKSLEFFLKMETEIVIFADYNTVDTIFRNLISNAIKFSKQNGIIQILIKEMPDFVEISVIDAGVGMSANVLKNVLDTDKYFTDPGTYGEKGSGLGLQLCFEFIKMNKGNYRVESKEEEGTNFTFTLPIEKNKVL